MQTQTSQARAVAQRRAGPGKHAKRAPRIDRPGKMLVSAVLIGGLVVAGVTTSEYAHTTGSMSAHHHVGGPGFNVPWMY